MLSSKLFRVVSLGGSQFNGLTMRPMSILGQQRSNGNQVFFGGDGSRNYCSSSEPEIIVNVENGVRQIVLNRPKKYNSITKSGYAIIVDALKEANTDDNTKAVIMTGAGSFYCAGNDLSNFDDLFGTGGGSSGAAKVTPAQAQALVQEAGDILEKFVASFIELEKPIIGLINGPAVGISVTVLGLFDAVLASDRATFHTPFSILGLSPEGTSSYTFPKIMGYARANQFLLFNKQFTAQEAYTAGLVTAVLPHDNFRDEALKIVKGYAKLPLQSLIYSKALVRNHEKAELHRANKAECDRLIERWISDDCKNALVNFFTKEKMARKSKK